MHPRLTSREHLHQQLRVKREEPFLGKTLISGKMLKISDLSILSNITIYSVLRSDSEQNE